MIMMVRRSNRSAIAPASGPNSSAGSSEVSHTPLTAYVLLLPLPPRSVARADSASRLSQSPRLESDRAIQSRRNGLMDNTPSLREPKGDLMFTAPEYRHWAPLTGEQRKPGDHPSPASPAPLSCPRRP